MAGRLGVAQGQGVPQRAGLVVGQGQDLGHRQALDVRGAEQVLDGELPAGEVALEGEVGQAHGGMMRDRRPATGVARAIARAMARTIVIAGSPTALGGHFGGMERSPGELRAAGLARRLGAGPGLRRRDLAGRRRRAERPGLAARSGPAGQEPGRPSSAYLPRLDRARRDRASAAPRADAEPRLLVLGGDCTSHVGALAGLRRARPDARFGLVWFDAHGDFNTPDTTPSGNVWGMPFAMLCGRGDPDLVAAGDGASVREADAALVGGQVLDETESRMLAASPVAHFGAGMIATDAGRAALAAWCATVATRIDAWYVAFDLDAIDAGEGLAVAMPETDGISVADAVAAVRIVAASGPVAGHRGHGRDDGGCRRPRADGRRHRGADRRRARRPAEGRPRSAAEERRLPRRA